MRIIILADSLYELGGVTAVTSSLASGFAAAGVDVTLVSVRRANTMSDAHVRTVLPCMDLFSGYRGLAARLQRLLARRGSPNGLHRLDLIGRRRASKRLASLVASMNSLDTTTIICMNVFAAQIATARQMSARIVVQWHESYEALHSTGNFARFRDVALRSDLVLMLTSTDWQRFYKAVPNVRGGYIPNPSPLCDREPEHTDGTVVVGVGRYHEVKNFALLIRAWAVISNEFPAWSLALYGEGPDRPRLEALAATVPRVHINGSTDEIERVLGTAGLLALTSRREGLPLVIVEAFACCTPVVATNSSPGTEELITQSNGGWLVDSEPSDGDFAAALRLALADHEERYSRGAQGRAYVERFSTAQVIGTWIDLLSSVDR